MRRRAATDRGGRARLRRLIRALAAAPLWLVVAAFQPAEDGWRERTARDVVVQYKPGSETLAERVTARASTAPAFPGLPEALSQRPVRIVLAPTPAAFDSLTGGRAPEWSAGVAIPARDLIVLPAYGPGITTGGELERTLRHELAHIAVHRALPGSIPRWFDEGYATWVSGGLDGQVAWELRLAFLLGRIPPLETLRFAWPRDATDARFAYILSATAVRHLATRRGPETFAAFMTAWSESGDVEAAARTAYGVSLHTIEEEWRSGVRRRYGWAFAIGQFTLVWAVIGLLLVVAYLSRRRALRRRIRRLAAEERTSEGGGASGLDDPWEAG